MRILRTESGSRTLTFLLNTPEREILVQILNSYPLVPPAHYQVSKGASSANKAEWQQLLDHALAEQRDKNRRQVAGWLKEPGRFEPADHGWKMNIRNEHTEWLLQVFNDVRVGSWLLLGSPEKPLDPTLLDQRLLRHWIAMEVSAWFQMALVSGGGLAGIGAA